MSKINNSSDTGGQEGTADDGEWLRLETRGSVHLYPLPPLPTAGAAAIGKAAGARARIVSRLRERHGIPEDWTTHPERGAPMRRTGAGHMLPAQGNGWDVSIIGGPVHESLLAIAQVYTVPEMEQAAGVSTDASARKDGPGVA